MKQNIFKSFNNLWDRIASSHNIPVNLIILMFYFKSIENCKKRRKQVLFQKVFLAHMISGSIGKVISMH